MGRGKVLGGSESEYFSTRIHESALDVKGALGKAHRMHSTLETDCAGVDGDQVKLTGARW